MKHRAPLTSWSVKVLHLHSDDRRGLRLCCMGVLVCHQARSRVRQAECKACTPAAMAPEQPRKCSPMHHARESRAAAACVAYRPQQINEAARSQGCLSSGSCTLAIILGHAQPAAWVSSMLVAGSRRRHCPSSYTAHQLGSIKAATAPIVLLFTQRYQAEASGNPSSASRHSPVL